MSMDAPDAIVKDPGIGLSFNLQIGSGQSLVLQTWLPRDGDVKDLNGMLDKLRVAAERQWAFAERERLRLQLKNEQDMAAKHAQRIAQVDENVKNAWGKKRGDPILSAKERQEQAQAYAVSEECKKRIAAVNNDIAKVEAIIGA